jgi:hypothetical protein
MTDKRSRAWRAAHKGGRPGPVPRPWQERFEEKVERTDDHWLFTASLTAAGYGHFPMSTQTLAHRVAWELYVGPLTSDQHLDHLCGVKRCVRPDHLEVVTLAENNHREVGRRTHCRRGHPWQVGARTCPTCRKLSSAKAAERRRSK